MTTQQKTKQVKVDTAVAAVPLPSADLIIYRFDQIDAQLQATNLKLDTMSGSFITKEEVSNLRSERMAQLKVLENELEVVKTTVKYLDKTNQRQQGSIDATRKITTLGLTLLGFALTALAIYFGVHK